MKQVEEMETVLTYKRIAQNIKITTANLEQAEKRGFIIQASTMRVDVPETRYSVVYKVVTNPRPKLIAKKIIKC